MYHLVGSSWRKSYNRCNSQLTLTWTRCMVWTVSVFAVTSPHHAMLVIKFLGDTNIVFLKGQARRMSNSTGTRCVSWYICPMRWFDAVQSVRRLVARLQPPAQMSGTRLVTKLRQHAALVHPKQVKTSRLWATRRVQAQREYFGCQRKGTKDFTSPKEQLHMQFTTPAR